MWLALLAVLATVVGSGAYALPMARKVLDAGYGREEIARALGTDVKLRQAELAFQYGNKPGTLELGARKAFIVGLLATGFSIWLGFADAIDRVLATALAGGAGLFTLLAGSLAARLYYRRQDKSGEHWLWFWNGPLGDWTAKLAALGLKPHRHRLPSAQGAESAIFQAAQRIFEQLPSAAQKALERLPEVLEQLELQTVGLRTWISEHDAQSPRERETPGAQVEARETADRRLSEAVTAVENLRIELERLRDGRGTVTDAKAKLAAGERIAQGVKGPQESGNP